MVDRSDHGNYICIHEYLKYAFRFFRISKHGYETDNRNTISIRSPQTRLERKKSLSYPFCNSKPNFLLFNSRSHHYLYYFFVHSIMKSYVIWFKKLDYKLI